LPESLFSFLCTIIGINSLGWQTNFIGLTSLLLFENSGEGPMAKIYKFDMIEPTEVTCKRSGSNLNILLEKHRKSLKFGKGDKFIRETEIKMLEYLMARRLK
jgi:hypothetical protein